MATNFYGGDFFSGGFFSDGTTPPAVVEVPGGGTSKRRRKTSSQVIRYADFESREAYEQALAAQINKFIVPVPQVFEADDGDEDDEALLKVIFITLQ